MRQSIKQTIASIDQIDQLAELLQARDSLRSVYSDMQTVWMATGLPLWEMYLARLSAAGTELNRDIEAWYKRQAALHAEFADDGVSK